MLKQGAYEEMFVNGESVFVSDYRAPTIADTGSTCFIGGPNPELAFPSCFAGELAELAVFGTALPAGERAEVEQHLRCKWLHSPCEDGHVKDEL